jgi:hypothetical protein
MHGGNATSGKRGNIGGICALYVLDNYTRHDVIPSANDLKRHE